jgi:hypothetical protein
VIDQCVNAVAQYRVGSPVDALEPQLTVDANRIQAVDNGAGPLPLSLANNEDFEGIRAEAETATVRLWFADRLCVERNSKPKEWDEQACAHGKERWSHGLNPSLGDRTAVMRGTLTQL